MGGRCGLDDDGAEDDGVRAVRAVENLHDVGVQQGLLGWGDGADRASMMPTSPSPSLRGHEEGNLRTGTRADLLGHRASPRPLPCPSRWRSAVLVAGGSLCRPDYLA